MANGDRPVHEIRHGAVKATIWRNPTNDGYMHNVVFSRSYTDGEEWKTSRSFSQRQMFNLERCILDAHAWLVFGSKEELSENSEESNG